MSTKDMSVYIKKNKLVTNLIWGAFILGLISNFISEVPISGVIAYSVTGLVFSVIFTVMAYNGWAPFSLQYFIASGLGVLTFVMGVTSPKLSNYLMIYVGLVFITLFHNYRSIALSGAIGLFLTNYFFFTLRDTMFWGQENEILISLNVFVVIISGVLIAQARIGEKMQKDIEAKGEEALAEKQKVDQLLGKVANSVKIISEFSQQVKSNIEATQKVSTDLTSTFSEVARGVETQASTVSEINDSMIDTNTAVLNVSSFSQSAKRVAHETLTHTNKGNEQVNELTKTMDNVQSVITSAAVIMKELNEQSQKISTILTTISDISNQTNLLALNASIEAARAGEHGRGFVVVANEVKRLAEDSQRSTKEIESILQDIKVKTEQVTVEVQKGEEIVGESIKVTKETEVSFNEILGNTQEVVSFSNKLEEVVSLLENASNKIKIELSEVTNVTQESSAMVEEVFASVEEQHQYIEEIIDSFKELESLTRELNGLVNE
ncbi:methyl-accepting chemotaxis protein [Alkalihalobacterium elongatum]|uniref:methyl-accepting chemotaxis protein n=1 Tax=Alkalihalobacterium elongatum TaxID=2675466 RepID=UPI001C1F608A|nr:methyl-accepting chemotaxis protein [Alkalihalobacterium elongatum]